MASVRKDIARVQRPTAADWPAWTDADIWELGPTESDTRWAAENLNDSWDHDGPTPDEVIDREAEEAEGQDRYENGLMF
jgi:hypothetical protein